MGVDIPFVELFRNVVVVIKGPVYLSVGILGFD